MSQDSRTFVVVGASLAGLRACEALREEGFEGRLVLIGAEPHAPYDRPPLSKEILRGQWDPEKTALRKSGLDDLRLDLRLGRTAMHLNAGQHTLALDDGETIAFDGLVLATGARVRRLEETPPLAGIHYLRTLDDALALRDELLAGPRVAILGAGFIGCEVASSCRARGLDVTLIEPLAAPMVRALGRALGGLAARLHTDNGVKLRCATRVVAIEGADRVERLQLSDGRTIAADVLVIGVGVQPQTQWLEGSGLEVEDGVVCDDRCATAVDGIVAAGDVARWHSARAGRLVRIEHWTNAAAQGRAAALRLLKGADAVEPYAPVPYVWSDQFGTKLQIAGHALPDDELHVVDGSFEEYRFVAIFGRSGRLTGVAGMGRPRVVAHYQALLEAGASMAEALASRPS
ncbi:MAG TPA: FAD-dependent oxidoreductase [Candidatus Limnocylindrales bacterium]|nr:FAD-dependent oxidoreductase [Candidatus Limnocylindrales bacterium]